MSKRAFRLRCYPAAVAFLAGIGATALAAYLATLEEQRHRRAEDAHRAAQDEKALHRARDGDRVVHKAEQAIRGLLRAPRMSESDRTTDIGIAQRWLRDYGRES